MAFNKDSMMTIFSLLNIPEGYMFDSFLGFTYSANMDTLKEISRALKVAFNGESLKKWEEGKSCHIFVQQGGFEGEKLPNYIHSVSKKDCNAHAKVYCLKCVGRQDSNRFFWRFIVASANLTNADELNAYVIYETDATNGVQSDEYVNFVESLNELFNSYYKFTSRTVSDEYFKKFMNGFCGIRKSDGRLLVVNMDVFNELVDKSNNCERRIVISPFVDASIIKALAKDKLTLVSRDNAIDKIASELTDKIDYMIFSNDEANEDTVVDVEENGAKKPNGLHAKVYIFAQNGKADIYIGSANATQKAFNGNMETLVHICDSWSDEKEKAVLSMFEQYLPPKEKTNVSAELRAEEMIGTFIRKIVASFEAKQDEYKISKPDSDEVCASYSIKIGAEDTKVKSQTETECVWVRTNQFRHVLTLNVSCSVSIDGETICKEVNKTIMVEGDLLNIDETSLVKEVQANIAGRLLAKSNRTGSIHDVTSSSSATKNTKSIIESDITTIYDGLCRIKTKNEARIFLENLEQEKDLLAGLDDADRELINQAANDLREVFGIE